MRVVRMLASAVIGMTGVLCGACATSDRAWTASDTALAAAEEAGHSWVTMGSAADVREESVLVMKGSPGIPFEPIGPLYARRRGLQLLWRISVIDTDLDHVVREVLLTLGTVVWTVEVDGLAVRLPGRLRDRDALPGPGPREEPSLVEPRGERPSAK
jgi:hypothetical protein